jgi:hypothetical protein
MGHRIDRIILNFPGDIDNALDRTTLQKHIWNRWGFRGHSLT